MPANSLINACAPGFCRRRCCRATCRVAPKREVESACGFVAGGGRRASHVGSGSGVGGRRVLEDGGVRFARCALARHMARMAVDRFCENTGRAARGVSAKAGLFAVVAAGERHRYGRARGELEGGRLDPRLVCMHAGASLSGRPSVDGPSSAGNDRPATDVWRVGSRQPSPDTGLVFMLLSRVGASPPLYEVIAA